MRLLVFDEELIAGGVETLRIHLLPQIAMQCESVVWVLPAHGGRELIARISDPDKIRFEQINWPRNSPYGIVWAVLRRIKKWVHADRAAAIEAWFRNARIRFLAERFRCTHFLTTCVFSQLPPRSKLPWFGFVCDVNPAIPEPVRANIASWVSSANGIFAISEFTRGELLRMVPNSTSRIHTLLLAPPARDLTVSSSKLAHFDFFCPAAANPHKNHLALFRACLRLAEAGFRFRLAISGPGTDGFLPSGHFDNPAMDEARAFLMLHSEIFGDRIEILGMLPPGEVAAVYDHSSCVILPSGYEGFGLPLAEALMHSLPVICSDIPPFQELLDLYDARESAHIVAVGDFIQIASAMEDFLKNPPPREALLKTQDRMARWTWKDAGRRCYELLSTASPGTSSN
jgi:glycosyltransferase involved in cell wall biosynthesis